MTSQAQQRPRFTFCGGVSSFFSMDVSCHVAQFKAVFLDTKFLILRGKTSLNLLLYTSSCYSSISLVRQMQLLRPCICIIYGVYHTNTYCPSNSSRGCLPSRRTESNLGNQDPSNSIYLATVACGFGSPILRSLRKNPYARLSRLSRRASELVHLA